MKIKKSINVVSKLLNREIFGLKTNYNQFYCSRIFYENIVPNLTLINVKKPHCHFGKFSPDGKYLISFSLDFNFVEIYRYNGPSELNYLLQNLKNNIEYLNFQSVPNLDEIQQSAFSHFFTLKHRIKIYKISERLCLEFSLFLYFSTKNEKQKSTKLENHNYVIVGTNCLSFALSLSDHNLSLNNEAIKDESSRHLQDQCLYLIDLEKGIITDRKIFKYDNIILSHNQDVYLYKNRLCVLSIRYQTIYIYDIIIKDDLAKFIELNRIGKYCYVNDEQEINKVYLNQNNSLAENQNCQIENQIINTLKHKILVFLYKIAYKKYLNNPICQFLDIFYQNFDNIIKLRMWKMQMLDKENLLIMYTDMFNLIKNNPEIHSRPKLFVVYNFITTSVVTIFNDKSYKYLEIFEKYCDHIRNSNICIRTNLNCTNDFKDNSFQFVSSHSNNLSSYVSYKLTMKAAMKAKKKNREDKKLLRNFLNELPIPAQSYNSSPYLDYSLFSYDERLINNVERPKIFEKKLIRFFSQRNGYHSFTLLNGLIEDHPPAFGLLLRKLVSFKFHPIDPFVISIVKEGTNFIVNLHIRFSS